jgi:putative hemolysin
MIVVLTVSYLSLVIGELVPKSLALRWAERYALLVARPLRLLGRIGGPVVWVLTSSSNLLLRVFGDKTSFVESAVSRDELLGVIDRATHAGGVSRRAADIASRAIDLDELAIASVMVPRNAIVSVPADATREQLAHLLDTTDEDRFPVRRSDHELIGYVTMRDVARLLGGRVEGPFSTLVRPLHFVPESARALRVLEQLQERRIPIAAIVDEGGGIEGIVDIEHLAEEVVGSLDATPSEEHAIQREVDGSMVVPASMRIHVANRLLDLGLPTSPQSATLGGLVLDRLGSMPTAGVRVTLPDVELEVIEASARRIHRIRVRRVPPASERGRDHDGG